MRVAHTDPATWRGPITPEALDGLRARAVEIVRGVTDNLDGLWARLRRMSPAVYTRIQKARSATQQPSSLARLLEEIRVLYAAGTPSARLRHIPIEIDLVIAQLDGPQPATAQALLEAVHAANLAGTGELVAESALALRPDRLLPLAPLTELRERTRQLIATLQVQLARLDGAIARQQHTPHGLRVLRGGRA